MSHSRAPASDPRVCPVLFIDCLPEDPARVAAAIDALEAEVLRRVYVRLPPRSYATVHKYNNLFGKRGFDVRIVADRLPYMLVKITRKDDGNRTTPGGFPDESKPTRGIPRRSGDSSAPALRDASQDNDSPDDFRGPPSAA